MDQVFFGFIGFAIGLAVLYGVVRLALTLRPSWLAPPSARPRTPSDSIKGVTDGWRDASSGHHHAS